MAYKGVVQLAFGGGRLGVEPATMFVEVCLPEREGTVAVLNHGPVLSVEDPQNWALKSKLASGFSYPQRGVVAVLDHGAIELIKFLKR